MENTITIRRWDNKNVIFSYTCENNTIGKTLEKAVKQGVSLAYANLKHRILNELDISRINLQNADLSCAELLNVDLSNAKLKSALFVCSHLNKVNFNGADLTGANFTYSILTDVTFDNAVGINDQCPKTGSFIGWKKCKTITNHPYIVKLEIPADAKRSSGTDRKCRCSKAKVLEIQNLDGTVANINIVYSLHNECFAYNIGEMVYPDSFNEEFWDECSHGIHFFMNREDAVNY